MSHPRFPNLLKAGFGTQDYTVPFWRLSYHRDREAAAELCAQTGHSNFGELLADYQSATQAYDALAQRLQDLGKPVAGPSVDWRLLRQRLEKLDAIHLTTARTRIVLALIKGGSVWETLALARFPEPVYNLVRYARGLAGELEALRSGPATQR